MPDQQLGFERWANFYVITSAAAVTLLGLLFVVITLAAERGRKDRPSIRIYLTPTVIYFSTVLLLSALLSIPAQTRPTAVICICLVGMAGLIYSALPAGRFLPNPFGPFSLCCVSARRVRLHGRGWPSVALQAAKRS